MGPGDFHALSLELLAATEEALNTIPAYEPTLEGAPSRAFVSPGQPAFDCCDQLAVQPRVVGEAPTSPGGLAQGRRFIKGAINHVAYSIWISRCIPSIEESGVGNVSIPTADALTDSSAQLEADVWAIWNHLPRLAAADAFLTLCGELFMDAAQSLLPQGGCGGWEIQVRIRLDGYDATPGS
jgi:hypothetical protein